MDGLYGLPLNQHSREGSALAFKVLVADGGMQIPKPLAQFKESKVLEVGPGNLHYQ